MRLNKVDFRLMYDLYQREPNHNLFKNFIQRQDDYLAMSFAKWILKNDLDMLEFLIDITAIDAYNSRNLSMIHAYKGREIPEKLIKGVIRAGPEVAQGFLGELMPHVGSIEKVHPKVFETIAESPKESYYTYKDLKRINLEAPEILIKSICTDMRFLQQYAMDIFRRNETFPEIVLRSISVDPRSSYNLVRILKTMKQPVPDFLIKSAKRYSNPLMQSDEKYRNDITEESTNYFQRIYDVLQ